tara:strand:+ start:2648 stop:3274 length:627 start_codon:yes stop_codon:yes gene_type:complete
MPVRSGFIHGTGTAINVELGWIPDYVRTVNLTDGDIIYENWLGKVIAFTSGGLATAVAGSKEIKPGDKITGLTNTGVYATIREIIIDSGTWAGGDAAGWLIFNAGDMVGSFGSENAEVNESGGNDITVALQNEDGIDIDTEVAGTTSAATNLQSYVGDADNGYAKGFTVGSTVSENGKLLGFFAQRNDAGEAADGVKVAGVLQKDGVW